MLDIEIEHAVAGFSRLTAVAPLTLVAKFVAATEDSRVTLWHADATSSDVLVDHPATVRAMAAFALTGIDQIAIGDDDGRVSIIRPLGTPDHPRALPGLHAGPVRALGVVPHENDWLVASADDEGFVMTRSVLGGQAHTLAGRHAGKVTAVCPAHEGRTALLLTASEDGNVFQWDPIDKRTVVDVVEVGSPLTSLCTFSKRGALWVAVGSENGDLVLWHIGAPQHQQVRLAEQGSSPIISLAWISDSPFPTLAALSADGIMELWSVSNETCVSRLALGEPGVAIVEPLGRASVTAAYGKSWAAMTVDLDLYVLDLESPGTGL